MPQPSDFPEFFAALNDRPPFPWQQRLAASVMSAGAWPEIIAVPTGNIGSTAGSCQGSRLGDCIRASSCTSMRISNGN